MFKQMKSALFWYYLYKFRKRAIFIFFLLLVALFSGFTDDVYENGSNQWITDEFDFGVMIEEIKFEITNTFGEV